MVESRVQLIIDQLNTQNFQISNLAAEFIENYTKFRMWTISPVVLMHSLLLENINIAHFWPKVMLMIVKTIKKMPIKSLFFQKEVALKLAHKLVDNRKYLYFFFLLWINTLVDAVFHAISNNEERLIQICSLLLSIFSTHDSVSMMRLLSATIFYKFLQHNGSLRIYSCLFHTYNFF